MHGEVVESIKEELDGAIQFTVAQAAPLTPPASGGFIVGLEQRRHGAFYFSNESVRWIPAVRSFLESAREVQ